jgi:hypothetical protein
VKYICFGLMIGTAIGMLISGEHLFNAILLLVFGILALVTESNIDAS